MSNFDYVKAAEEIYTVLYTRSSHASFIRSSDEKDTEAPSITTYEVRNALQEINLRKTVGDDGITLYLFKDGRDIMLEKLAALYARSLTSSTVPEDWKNEKIILILQKEDVKQLKKYRPISSF